MTPETRYAKSGDVHIAYQVVGDGPVDLVFIPGWITHVELAWEDPLEAAFRRRLASFSRLILFDKRGTGLSDRVPPGRLPILAERMDDGQFDASDLTFRELVLARDTIVESLVGIYHPRIAYPPKSEATSDGPGDGDRSHTPAAALDTPASQGSPDPRG